MSKTQLSTIWLFGAFSAIPSQALCKMQDVMYPLQCGPPAIIHTRREICGTSTRVQRSLLQNAGNGEETWSGSRQSRYSTWIKEEAEEAEEEDWWGRGLTPLPRLISSGAAREAPLALIRLTSANLAESRQHSDGWPAGIPVTVASPRAFSPR